MQVANFLNNMETQTLSLGKTCRTCMTETDDIKTLFQDNENNIQYSEMLSYCTSLRILRNDGLPDQICKICELQLNSAYLFRKKCLLSDEELRNQLGLVDSYTIIKQEPDEVKQELESELIDPKPSEQPVLPIKRGPGRPRKVGRPKLQPNHACEICQKEFSKESKLVRHMTVHDATRKPYECDICKKRFLRIDLLTRHMVIHTARLSFTNNMKFDHDSLDAKSDTSEYCPDLLEPDCEIDDESADKPLIDSNDLPKEEIKIEENSICSGMDIEMERENDGDITENVPDDDNDTNDDKKVFKCEKCPQTFKKLDKLESHIQKAHRTKRKYGSRVESDYSCKICKKTFNRSSHLRRHEKIHLEVKEHKCTLCPKTFSRGEFLINHLNKHSGIKPCVCHICNKSFAKQGVLNKHILTHSGEKTYLCNICGKSFNASSTLRQHVFRHSGLKPFECSVCHAKFTEKGTLKKHMITHTGEKAHVCDECGNRFTTGFSLIKHKRIHSGERPYPCDYCPKRFISLFILQNHVRTHTGEKPFQCQYCTRAFAQKSDMIKHTRTHTGESPYVCTICGQAFKQPSALKTHGKTHERTLHLQAAAASAVVH